MDADVPLRGLGQTLRVCQGEALRRDRAIGSPGLLLLSGVQVGHVLSCRQDPAGTLGGQVISGGGDEGALGAAVVPLDAARRTLERRMVAAALARHAGRLAAASRELGLTSQGLRKAIKRLGLEAAPGAEGVA
jgi:hypothetical protein